MMLSKVHNKMNQKGFTLIELLIVVAIIGILAAIAIPQFAAYRERAFNSAATSDLRNIKIAMEAYMADHQDYPLTVTQTDGNVVVATATGTSAAGVGTELGRLSTGVTLLYLATALTGDTFAMTTVHTNGTFFYGTASDSTAVFRAPDDTAAIILRDATAFNTAAAATAGWSQL